MGKKTKSARGELVDFDLLKIKEQIASAPPTIGVRARQDFIDKRLRRRLKTGRPVAPKIEANKETGEEPKLPTTEDTGETKMIDQVEEKPKTTRSKQKARPKKTEE